MIKQREWIRPNQNESIVASFSFAILCGLATIQRYTESVQSPKLALASSAFLDPILCRYEQ